MHARSTLDWWQSNTISRSNLAETVEKLLLCVQRRRLLWLNLLGEARDDNDGRSSVPEPVSFAVKRNCWIILRRRTISSLYLHTQIA